MRIGMNPNNTRSDPSTKGTPPNSRQMRRLMERRVKKFKEKQDKEQKKDSDGHED